MLRSIYKLDPIVSIEDNICYARLTFDGKVYEGAAVCHPRDRDFFSQKVGFNIALSRARIKILQDMVNKTKAITQIKQQILLEATQFGKVSAATVDPTGAFTAKVLKADKLYNQVKQALRKEKKWLATYITDQDKVVERVKNYRARTETNK